jgi:hypothetical protein
MPLVFGKTLDVKCLQDLPDPGVHGESLCLGYGVEYYGLVLPGYVRDAGYMLLDRSERHYWPIDQAEIRTLQQAHRLPETLPPYSVPASTYVWGFSLWPTILLMIALVRLRRRVAIRKHAEEAPPLAPGATAIEVTPTHSILQFHLFATAPKITIDGPATPRAWGQTWTFPVEPGRHCVAVSYTWIWERGREEIWVDVEPGEIKRISYHVGAFFGAATIKAEGSMPKAKIA